MSEEIKLRKYNSFAITNEVLDTIEHLKQKNEEMEEKYEKIVELLSQRNFKTLKSFEGDAKITEGAAGSVPRQQSASYIDISFAEIGRYNRIL